MPHDLTRKPLTDPTQIYRYRDGLYAQDMLIVGIVWLDLFSWLGRNPSSADAIVKQFDLKERPADVMLTLFVAMGLLERKAGCYQVTPIAREFLTSESPWFLGPYYASLKDRTVCVDLLKVLRTGTPANWGSQSHLSDWHRAMETPEFAASFTAGMDCRGILLAQAVAEAVDLSGRERLLDVAGGSGIYACSLCAHFSRLTATVLERPPVDQIARNAITGRGFEQRVTVFTGDMLLDPWPEGADVHLLSNVLHDWGESEVRSIIAKSFASLAQGGLLIVHDAHLNDEKTGPLHVAEYSVMLMHSTEGRCYSVGEISAFLKEVGFRGVQFRQTAAARSVVTATKPRAG